MARVLRSDVPTIFANLGIKYVTFGKNVARDNVNIKCPYCRDDPSEHLGIGIKNGRWSCWRNGEHRGNNLAVLITKVTNIGYREAKRVCYGEKSPVLFDMESVSSGSVWRHSETAPAKDIDLRLSKKAFRTFRPQSIGVRPFINYLAVTRGFKHDAWAVADYYQLRFARIGDYSGRIIIPHYLEGQLVTWTARSIYQNAELRYKALPAEKSILTTKETLYNYDNVQAGGDALILVEGQFDVIKLDFYAKNKNVRAIGLGNTQVEDPQLALLNTLIKQKRFKKCFVLLDPGFEFQAMRILGLIKPIFGTLPEPKMLRSEIGDPGDMTKEQIEKLISEM